MCVFQFLGEESIKKVLVKQSVMKAKEVLEKIKSAVENVKNET